MSESDERGQIGLAMVALAEERIPSGEDILRYVNTKWPMTTHFNKADVKDDTIFFDDDDGEIVFVSLMRAPIPAGDLEYPCKTAFHWPEALTEFDKSVAHAIISVMPRSNENPVDMLMRTTMLAQAVSQLAGGLGIYWGPGELVERPDIFAKSALGMTRSNPPIGLWVGVKFQKEKDGSFSCVTRGLEQFDLSNVEIQSEKVDANFAYEFVGNIAAYLVKNGPVIKDGDTVGETNDQRITVRLAPSIVDPGKQVYRLCF